MNTATLNNGLQIPLVGLGTWKSEPGEVVKAVYEAIKTGYRHIDCAWKYENQEEVGAGIRKAIEDGLVKREELWITSKLWNDFHRKEDVAPHVHDILRQLGLDYLDLLLIHWPASNIEGDKLDPPYEETWGAVEALLPSGIVRTIGVSNMTIKKLEAMKEYAIVWPAVNQVEMHPMWRQNELLDYCQSMGTHVTAYSPLGSSDSASMYHHAGYSLLQHEVVKKVAGEVGKTPGQVLIRWAIQHGTSVLPKSVTPHRIRENFDVFDWCLSKKQYAALSSIEPQVRMIQGTVVLQAGGPYKTPADIWND